MLGLSPERSSARLNNARDENKGSVSADVVDDVGDDVSTDDGSAGQLHDILLEAGYTKDSQVNKDAEMTLLKKGSTGDIQRKRTSSSGVSFTEMSFVTAAQHELLGGDQGSDASITSRNIDEEEIDLEAQHNRLLRDQFLPAPAADGDDCDEKPRSIQILPLEDTAEDDEEGLDLERTNDQQSQVIIPTIAISNVQVLAANQKKVNSETLIQVRQEMIMTTEEEGNDDDDDQHSVTSVQSLISVVAELIALPIRIFHAALINLEHEISIGKCAPRAVYLSATVFKLACSSKCSSIEDHPTNDKLFAPLGLHLDRSLSSGSSSNTSTKALVISAIDPNGVWSGTPFCVGDRLVSINHVPVGDWEISAIYNFWNGLEDSSSATVVVHNPHPSANAQCVEAMVTKPEASCRTGLGMRSSRVGRVKISRIDGLFIDSLLNVKDQILSINGQLLDGCDSAQTAQLILQSPKYVSVVAKTDPRNAFVISSTNATKGRSSSADTSNSDRLFMLAADGSSELQSSLEGDSTHPNGDGRSRRLGGLRAVDRSDVFRGPWTALKVAPLVGSLYIIGILAAGLYAVFSKQAGLTMVMGVFVVVVIMATMINVTVRGLQKQQQQGLGPGKKVQRCSMFQLSCTIIIGAALAFMCIVWKHYDIVTSDMLVISGSTVFAPMLVFVNLSLFLPKSVLEGDGQDDDWADDSVNGEHIAVASLAGSHAGSP